VTTKFAITTVAFAAVLACGTPTGGCGCSPVPPVETHLVGLVTNGNGPVTDAQVTARVFPEDCPSVGNTRVYAHREAVVDAAGHFDFQLETRQPDTLCARLVARSASDSIVRDSVRVFVLGNDSTRVDFVFP
jgi:hypothetical protein